MFKIINSYFTTSPIYDSCDRLNFVFTPSIYACFSIVIAFRLHMMRAIECWTTKEFTPAMVVYMEDACDVQDYYFLPKELEKPDKKDHKLSFSFYQWTPVVYLVQAATFIILGRIWKWLSHIAGDMPGLVQASKSCASSMNAPHYKDNIDQVAMLLKESTRIDFARNYSRFHPTRWCTCCFYLLVKILTISAIAVKIYYLKKFHNDPDAYDFLHGFFTVSGLYRGEKIYSESERFPRTIACEFFVRENGSIQQYDVQCVLRGNQLNQTLFLLTWVWLEVLILINTKNLLSRLLSIAIPAIRRRPLYRYLMCHSSHPTDKDQQRHFVTLVSADASLALNFIHINVSSLVAMQLVNSLYDRYTEAIDNDAAGHNDGYAADVEVNCSNSLELENAGLTHEHHKTVDTDWTNEIGDSMQNKTEIPLLIKYNRIPSYVSSRGGGQNNVTQVML